MNKNSRTEVKVGLFVTIGVFLIMLAVFLLGGAENFLSRQNHYRMNLPSVEGLVEGAKVVLNGIPVGVVNKIDFDPQAKDVRIDFQVQKKYEEWIRKDSTAEVLTQGVLGDKYVSLSSGSPDQPILPSKSEIPNRPTKDLAQFLSKGDQLMVTLNQIASSMDRLLKTFENGNRAELLFESASQASKNLAQITRRLSEELDGAPIKKSSKSLNAILDKINNGTGTLGALINDPSLYYDARALMGGANRNRIVRNLVRKTIEEGEQGSDKDKAAKDAAPKK